MESMNPNHVRARRRSPGWLALAAMLCLALPASAAPSGSAGSGVWDVPSAESKRAGHLGLGFFTSYRTLGLRDSLNTHFNDLRGGAHAIFGIPGGFEVSGTLPLFADYVTQGKGSAPFGEDIDLRYGDLAGRLRWTTPFLMPGMRWGAEGEVTFPTGNDDVVMLPTRGAVKPYTGSETNYAIRSMLTWDARGASSTSALRLHAGVGYHFQGDESRYFSGSTALPLDLPAPAEDKENDFLTVFTAAELDLARVTLFGELSTEQYVNQRGLIRGKENRVTLTPGLRFWLPGGMSLSGAYSMNFSEDDASTAFDPGRAYSDNQLRVSLSLGTIYRNARALQEAASEAPTPMTPAAPVVKAAVADTAASMAKPVATPKTTAIEARHETQTDQRQPAARLAPPAPMVESDSVERTVTVVKKKTAIPTPAGEAAPPMGKYIDSDGDGIPDDQDHCPLLAEDFDGFQDMDGCPDLDNDRDGILDVNDDCPNDPETYNGYYDFDGCPDEVPSDRRSAEPRMSSAPSAVTPAAPVRPQPSASAGAAVREAVTTPERAATDSLRRAIEAERVRNAELASRLGRLELNLRQMSDSLAAQRQAPVPAAAPKLAPAATVAPAAPAMPAARPASPVMVVDTAASARELQLRSELEAQRRRSAELEAWVRALEPGSRSVASGDSRSTIPATPMLAPPIGSAQSLDNAARLRELEAEIASLKTAAAENRASKSAVPSASKSAPDTTGRAILERLAALQAVMDSLAAARPATPPTPQLAAPAPAETAPVVDAARTLDLMLPIGVARVFPEIQFASGGAALQAAADDAIESVATVLRQVPEARVEVVGHTDDSGRSRTNMTLSRARARVVADALIRRGVSASQLTVIGRGDTAPIASNATVEGRQANRRVEFTRTR